MNQISKKKSNKTYYSLINVNLNYSNSSLNSFSRFASSFASLKHPHLVEDHCVYLLCIIKVYHISKSQVYRNGGLWQFLQTNDPKLAAIWLLTITKSIETRDWFLENHLRSPSTIVKDFISYVSMQHYIACLVGWRFHMNQNKENVWRIERETRNGLKDVWKVKFVLESSIHWWTFIFMKGWNVKLDFTISWNNCQMLH